MPGTISDGPSVTLSFANNFWGPSDAGVNPLLQRMQNAKQTCDELKAFYTTRATIEDEYARKLLALSRKPLGSEEAGTLRASLDVVRGEVEQIGKSHQNTAGQMKTELEEPLAAFAGAMKERRKIVQGGIEKLLKTKTQQTQQVNKTRDRFEQECLKIKGYLAQGHMVMGHEERKNKAKLEKTQISVATSNSEYEAAVKVLEETTGRWNRDWKAAADKFQDLEEERLDFMKSSLWSFANIASTVCVSDDASCEKIRLSLENCEVEKDIISFIKERGTGQEIPDPPKYINFCRGDVNDTQSETSEDESYSVAQFQRTINPAFRSSSPQPSVFESHHDPRSSLARDMGHHEPDTPPSREATLTPQKTTIDRPRQPHLDYQKEHTLAPQNITIDRSRQPQLNYQKEPTLTSQNITTDRSRQPKLDYQMEPTLAPRKITTERPRQPQLDYQKESALSQKINADRSRQPQLDYQMESALSPQKIPTERRQPQLDYQREPTSAPQKATTERPRQPQLDYQREPTSAPQKVTTERPRQPQLDYQREPISAPQKVTTERPRQPQLDYQREPVLTPQKITNDRSHQPQLDYQKESSRLHNEQFQHGPLAAVPHDPYPMDGMTMLCRTGPPSDKSSANSGARPSSRDSQSDYSNPTSFSSQEPPSGKQSPVKQDVVLSPASEKQIQKKSGFFQSRSPFRRKSKHIQDTQSVSMTPANRNTWSASGASKNLNTPTRQRQMYGQDTRDNMISDRPSRSPEPVDPRSSFQLNVGNNIFDVATPDRRTKATQNTPQDQEDLDPIAQALAELKGVTKQSSLRVSADQYHRISTPALNAMSSGRAPSSSKANDALTTGMRGTPPPSYDQPVQRLGPPQPAFTSKAMQQTSQKYISQTQSIFNTPQRPSSQDTYNSRPQSRPGTQGNDVPRATSPLPQRSASPRPNLQEDSRQYRSASPNPYAGRQQLARQQSSAPQKHGSDQASFRQNSYNDVARSVSPVSYGDHSDRPGSSHRTSDMSIQLAPGPDEAYGGSQRGRGGGGRPGTSGNSRPMTLYGDYGESQQSTIVTRQRSKSVADVRQFTRDGRPILHFARAMYMYQAAIPEELSFAKGDILAVLRFQDDGWWEAEVTGKDGGPGLVPSNYLQNC